MDVGHLMPMEDPKITADLLREFVRLTGYPITSTLMGLGAYPASDRQWLGMLGMHGTYEANLAMHDCDVMVAVGARFDDRITGRIDAFSPGSQKIHIDIDPSSINKNVRVDIPIVGDVAYTLEDMLRIWKSKAPQLDKAAHKAWWKQIDQWRAKKSLSYKNSRDVIMPQYAVERRRVRRGLVDPRIGQLPTHFPILLQSRQVLRTRDR